MSYENVMTNGLDLDGWKHAYPYYVLDVCLIRLRHSVTVRLIFSGEVEHLPVLFKHPMVHGERYSIDELRNT